MRNGRSGRNGTAAWVAAAMCVATLAVAARAAARQDAPDQDDDAPAVQQAADTAVLEAFKARAATIRELAPKLRATAVSLFFDEGEKSGAGSGTIITKDGWILTAGHVGVRPGRAVSVRLADGTELKGRTAGQLLGPGQDVGLVKADPAGRELPAATLGFAESLKAGDAILVFGHPLGPEIQPWRPPPLRAGMLVGRTGNVLTIDAPLSPGDSGGGVFDLQGRLVGINSVASDRPDLNAAMSSELAAEHIEELKKDVALGEFLQDAKADGPDDRRVPVDTMVGERGDPGAREHAARRRAVLQAVAPLADAAAESLVGVIVDSRDAACGTFVDRQGRVLTKDSELGNGMRRIDVLLPDGLTVRARRVARDPALDLAILETGAVDTDPVEFGDDAPAVLGDPVVTVGRGMLPVAVGVRSLESYVAGAADNASRAYLGVGLRAATDEERATIPGGTGVLVSAVAAGSGAAAAGIAVGDVLLRVDGTALASPESAAGVLRAHAPGDTVQVAWVHAGERREAPVRLLRPAWIPGPGNTGAELSRRMTGFGPVIMHDGVVAAELVGGPVVDLDGRVVGLNIARADRTKTYALPASAVRGAVVRMLADLAAGKAIADEDPGTGLKPVAFGRAPRVTLRPVDARVAGPTNAQGADPDVPAIVGWADAEDAAVWRIAVPDAGRYDVELDVVPVAGGGVDVVLGDELMTARVPRGSGPDAEPVLVRVGEAYVGAAGQVTLRVQTLGRPLGPLMALRGVRLTRLDVMRAFERVAPLLRLDDLPRMRREDERARRRDPGDRAK